jgi:dynactin 5
MEQPQHAEVEIFGTNGAESDDKECGGGSSDQGSSGNKATEPQTEATGQSDSSSSSTALVAAKDDYITTMTGNFISRQATLINPKNVEIKGRTIIQNSVVLDASAPETDGSSLKNTMIRITGRYCYIGSNTTILPPPVVGCRELNKTDHVNTIPVSIGSHTIIYGGTSSDRPCVIHAAAIGSYCCIGHDVFIQERVIIKDCCVIAPHTYIPADTVIPPFTHVSSLFSPPLNDNESCNRSLVMYELPPSTMVEIQEKSMEIYHEIANRQ